MLQFVLLLALAQEEQRLDVIPDHVTFEQVTFSQDGRHVGYLARETDRICAVIDGKKGEPFENVKDLDFLKDGRAVYRVFQKGKQALVLDGKKGPWVDDMKYPIETPDGTRIITEVTNGTSKHVMVDLDLQEAFGEIRRVKLGRLGSRYAYIASLAGRTYVVVDGKKSPAYDSVWFLFFTPDGNHCVYDAKIGEKAFVVQDGVPGIEYDLVCTLDVGPDGLVGYGADKGKEHLLVLGSCVISRPKAVGFSCLTLGLSRLAFVEWIGDDDNSGRVVVASIVRKGEAVELADVKTQDCSSIRTGSFVFSPDGKELSYILSTGGRQIFVSGRNRLELPDKNLASIEYSPDGRRVSLAFMNATQSYREFVIFDERHREEGKRVVWGPKFSPTGTAWYWIWRDSNGRPGYRLYVNGQPQEESDSDTPVRFTKDGGAYAYLVKSGARSFVVVNGKRLGEFDSVHEFRLTDDGRTIRLGVRVGRELWWKVREVK